LDEKPAVLGQSSVPAGDVGGAVVYGAILDASVTAEESRCHLGDEFLLGVVVLPER
jgi:hypothetical protein